jgi:hypothetical protein
MSSMVCAGSDIFDSLKIGSTIGSQKYSQTLFHFLWRFRRSDLGTIIYSNPLFLDLLECPRVSFHAIQKAIASHILGMFML